MIRAVIFDMYETLITHYHGQSDVYFSANVAADSGVPVEKFRPRWRGLDGDRTTGKYTLEETLALIMRENHCYSSERIRMITQKRKEFARSCFQNLHPEIIPMLTALRERGILVALISNCFSEEAEVIRESILFPYFDEVCLSYELGVKKPDAKIYEHCMHALGVLPEECVYVGDGGSQELEAARKVGMTAVQAAWYLKDGTLQPCERKREFTPMEQPLDVLKYIKR